MRQDSIITILYTVLKECIDSITLPTGKTLLPSLKFSVGIFLVTLVSNLFSIYTVISWQGAGLACICLLGLCYIERSEDNEVSRLYRDVKLRSKDIARRGKSAGTDKQDAGTSDGTDESSRESGDGAERIVRNSAQ